MRLLPRRLKRAAGAAGEPDAPGAEGCEILRFSACSLATVLFVHRTRCPMFIFTHPTLLSTPRSHYSIHASIILRPSPLSPGAWRPRSGKSRKMKHFFKKNKTCPTRSLAVLRHLGDVCGPGNTRCDGLRPPGRPLMASGHGRKLGDDGPVIMKTMKSQKSRKIKFFTRNETPPN